MPQSYIEPCITCPTDDLDWFSGWLTPLGLGLVLWENESKDRRKGPTTSFDRFKPRVTLTTTSKNQSKAKLDSLRLTNVIVVQHCSSPDVTKWACQDQRVDGLLFDNSSIHQLVDTSTARMMVENEKYLEVNCADFLRSRPTIGALRNVRKALFRTSKKGVPTCLASQANRPYHLRAWRSMQGLATFLGMTEEDYKTGQTWLRDRIQRNISRLDPSFVAPGIWLVDEEVDNS